MGDNVDLSEKEMNALEELAESNYPVNWIAEAILEN